MIHALEYLVLKSFKLIKICLAIVIIFSFPKRDVKKRLLIVFMMIVAGTSLDVFVFNQNTVFVFLIIDFIIVSLLFSSNLKSLLCSYVLSYLIVETVDSILYAGLSLISGLSIDDFTRFDNKLLDILFTMPSVVMWFVVALLLKRKKGLHFNANIGNYAILLFGVLVASFQIIFIMYFIGDGEHGDIDVTNWMVIALMVGSSVSILFSIMYVYKLSQIDVLKHNELEMMKKKDAITTDYYLSLLSGNEEARAFQHDIKHFMKLTREYIVDGNNKDALKILDDICNADYLNSNKIVYSQNKVIDATINGVLGNAILSNEIKFDYKGLMPQNIGVSDIDMCALLSNVLENAYEALQKCKSQKKISMSSRISGNLIIIEIKNNTIRSEKDLVLKTSKGGANHGYGISNIYRIVNKYNGDYSYEIKDGIFCSWIILEEKVEFTEKI